MEKERATIQQERGLPRDNAPYESANREREEANPNLRAGTAGQRPIEEFITSMSHVVGRNTVCFIDNVVPTTPPVNYHLLRKCLRRFLYTNRWLWRPVNTPLVGISYTWGKTRKEVNCVRCELAVCEAEHRPQMAGADRERGPSRRRKASTPCSTTALLEVTFRPRDMIRRIGQMIGASGGQRMACCPQAEDIRRCW